MRGRRILRFAVATAAVFGMTTGFGALNTGTGLAAAPAHAAMAQSAAVAPSVTRSMCTTPGHARPCWATTQNAGNPALGGCNDVPLFLRAGGVHCVGGNDLVRITCWFTGSPTVSGDGIQDHVTAENGRSSTPLTLVGHIPDHYINLGGQNPADVNIPHC